MSKYLDEQGLAYVWTKAKGTFVEQEPGMVLSENNYSDEDKAKLDGMFNVGVFARNIGDIEDELVTVRNENAGIIQALAAADVRALNTPNMLQYQPEGVTVNIPNGPVIVKYAQIPAEDATAAAEPLTFTYEDESITADMVLHYVRSPNWNIVTSDMVTATVSAGSATVTIAARSGEHEDSTAIDLCFCVRQSAMLPPGEAARYYMSSKPFLDSAYDPLNGGQEQDEISERVVTLTGDDIINDDDGATYNTAVAFTVANAPISGYNNSDNLIFNYGTDGGTYTRQDGSTYTYQPSGVLDLVEGETYTMSCFARITSGTKARLELGYGYNYRGYLSTGYEGNHKYIDISNTAWKRVVFSFVFHETATYEAAGANPYTVTVNHKKRVGFGVCRKWDGTVQLAGFRLTHGGLYGDNTIDTLAAEVAELRNSIAAAQAINTRLTTAESNVTALQTRLAEAEAKNECMQALGFAGHGIRVEKVFSGVNDTGIGEYILEANHEAGDAYAYRNGSGWIVMAYDADNDSWVSWP